MIIDGKHIAENIYAQLRERVALRSKPPLLTIITCAPRFETEKYLALKQKKAATIPILTDVRRLPEESTTDDVLKCVEEAKEQSDGIIVQLPLPPHIDRDRVLSAVPPSHDVDALNPETQQILSPVVGALQSMCTQYDLSLTDKNVTIIGTGRLVGLPAFHWATSLGAHVSLVTKETIDITTYTKTADVIITGAGVPGLITIDMIKEGVIIFDAGTSEDGGELKGDASPHCAEKAALFSPVPGGIGPITIATLLANVVDCAERRKPVV